MSNTIDRETYYFIRKRRMHFVKREGQPLKRLGEIYAKKKFTGIPHKSREEYTTSRLH